MRVGERSIVKTWHPDGHCWCWEVRELSESTGRYSKPGDVHWSSLTKEPFSTEEKAQEYFDSLK